MEGCVNPALLVSCEQERCLFFKRQPIIGALVMIVAVCFVLGEERYVDKENIGTINVFPPTFSF